MSRKAAPSRRTWVVTLADTKSGTGKTTLASALAVRAAEENPKVALIDLDPQEACRPGGPRRGKTKEPEAVRVGCHHGGDRAADRQGWGWVFIDTGPAKIELIEPGIAVADLVLIPTRPSAFDIEQAAIAVELCESHGKPHAFVLNHAPAGSSKLLKSSIDFIRQTGAAVLDGHLSFRSAYMAALTVGISGLEVDKSEVARKEIDALWASVVQTLDQKVAA
jgi:chromosome partitioning protein